MAGDSQWRGLQVPHARLAQTASELGFQYFVTLNEDDAFKESEAGFDLRKHVLPVRLTDATEEGGVFGVRFE